ncbi:MAG: hypothetical protein AB1782_18055 [Cyanobacteriota bacterium]
MNNQKKIGFITCKPEKLECYFPTNAEPDIIPIEPPFTPDDQIIVDELRLRDYQVEPVIWGEVLDNIIKYDILIVRSPWDYMDNAENRELFLNWIEFLQFSNIKLENKPQLIRWLYDKHYLRDFEANNILIVPTNYIEKGQKVNLESFYKFLGPFVIKPSIAAAGEGLKFIKKEEEAIDYQDEFNNLASTRSYIIQAFIPEIATNGEWSLIFIDGKYSHSIHKTPMEGEILVHAEAGGGLQFIEPSDIVINTAVNMYDKIIKAFRETMYFEVDKINDEWVPLYLRIDVIETSKGILLSECEGVEPELFFRANQESISTFVNAIENRLSIIPA